MSSQIASAVSEERVWFTADTHFGHGGALGRFRRPFGSVLEMNSAMVARWNACVQDSDQVWHLGDFALGRDRRQAEAILAELRGRKHLIIGNNDHEEIARLRGWESVQHYVEVEIAQVRLVLCHYPFRTWNAMSKGAYNLHGHSHGQLKGLTRQVDVGVDVWDFRPISLDQIRARKRRP